MWWWKMAPDSVGTSAVQQLADEVASGYEKRGYRVQRDVRLPKGFGLPPQFRADIVATAPSDRVVVEVKSRSGLAADPAIQQLAKAIASQPGWRFEMVLAPQAESDSDTSFEAESLTPEEAIAVLHGAEAANRPDGVASFIRVLGAAEAIMRYAAAVYGISLRRTQAPSTLTKALYAEGHVEEPELDFLLAAFRLRSALVHGYHVPNEIGPVASDTASVVLGMWLRWASEADQPVPGDN